MTDHIPRYKTWGRSRSVRLAGFDYREHVPYHVTVCAKKGTQPFRDTNLASMVCETIHRKCYEYGAYLGAYCLMPDHLHVLLSPAESGMTLGTVIGRIKGLTTKQSWEYGWTGVLWQQRFHDHIVRKSEGISAVARYINENPDRKGLRVDYPYRFIDRGLI